jgi:K+-transporting ATPase KdpF subunit
VIAALGAAAAVLGIAALVYLIYVLIHPERF